MLRPRTIVLESCYPYAFRIGEIPVRLEVAWTYRGKEGGQVIACFAGRSGNPIRHPLTGRWTDQAALERSWETGIPLLEDSVTTRVADSLLAQGLAQLVR